MFVWFGAKFVKFVATPVIVNIYMQACLQYVQVIVDYWLKLIVCDVVVN